MEPDLNKQTIEAHYIYVVYIRSTTEKVWAALTDPMETSKYCFGASLHSDLKPGNPFSYFKDDQPIIEGRLVEIDPGRKLVHTFDASWIKDAPSRVSYDLQKKGQLIKLTLVHDGFTAGGPTHLSISEGWPYILSALKTLLETGAPLENAG